MSSNLESSPKRQVRSGSAAPTASTTAKSTSKKTPAATPTIVERRPRPSKSSHLLLISLIIDETCRFVSLADYINTKTNHKLNKTI